MFIYHWCWHAVGQNRLQVLKLMKRTKMLFCLHTNYGVLFLILYSKPNKSHKIINITLWCLKSTDNEDCKAKKQCLNIDLTCRWALRMQKYQQNNLCLHKKKCMSLHHQPLTCDHAFANKRICFSPAINRFLISVSASQRLLCHISIVKVDLNFSCWLTLIYGRQEFDIFATTEFHFDPWTILVTPSFQQEVLFEGKTISRLIFVYIQWN